LSDQVWHTYTTGKMILPYVIIFRVCEWRTGRQF
jgi:hypothetical protein